MPGKTVAALVAPQRPRMQPFPVTEAFAVEREGMVEAQRPNTMTEAFAVERKGMVEARGRNHARCSVMGPLLYHTPRRGPTAPASESPV